MIFLPLKLHKEFLKDVKPENKEQFVNSFI